MVNKKQKFIRKDITIKEYQDKFIKKNSINLSQFVQAKIDEIMEIDRDVKKHFKNKRS